MTSDFDALVLRLNREGYKVVVTDEASRDKPGTSYRMAIVTGKNIKGGFCEPCGLGDVHYNMDGKFAADNVRCFDKWSKCPMVADLPRNTLMEEKILASLKLLGSEEGYIISNSYDYLDDNPFVFQPG
jgi:hypothetical protein